VERDAFVAALHAAATVPVGPQKLPPALVVAVVRADFLGRLIAYPPLKAALDAGVTLIDTADAYHLKPGETGHNERLIAKALASYGGDASDVLVATKGGHVRPATVPGRWTARRRTCGRPPTPR